MRVALGVVALWQAVASAFDETLFFRSCHLPSNLLALSCRIFSEQRISSYSRGKALLYLPQMPPFAASLSELQETIHIPPNHHSRLALPCYKLISEPRSLASQVIGLPSLAGHQGPSSQSVHDQTALADSQGPLLWWIIGNNNLGLFGLRVLRLGTRSYGGS